MTCQNNFLFCASLSQWRTQETQEMERKSEKGNHYWKETKHSDIVNGKKKSGRSGSKESLVQLIRIGRSELNDNLIISNPETIS